MTKKSVLSLSEGTIPPLPQPYGHDNNTTFAQGLSIVLAKNISFLYIIYDVCVRERNFDKILTKKRAKDSVFCELDTRVVIMAQREII